MPIVDERSLKGSDFLQKVFLAGSAECKAMRHSPHERSPFDEEIRIVGHHRPQVAAFRRDVAKLLLDAEVFRFLERSPRAAAHFRVGVHEASDGRQQGVLVESLPVSETLAEHVGRTEVVGGVGRILDPVEEGRVILVDVEQHLRRGFAHLADQSVDVFLQRNSHLVDQMRRQWVVGMSARRPFYAPDYNFS